MWSTGSADKLTIKSWDDDHLGLVFEAESGDTHLLEHSAVEVLQSLDALEAAQKSPATVDQLAEAMSARFSADDPGQIRDFIATTLLQLREIGLATDTSV